MVNRKSKIKKNMNLINQSELLGLGNLPAGAPAKREVKAAMRAKSGAISTKGATGKAMYEKLLHLLPPDIQNAVRAGQLQLVDEVLYSVKPLLGMRDRELMESGDNKQVGVTNVDKQKIEANKWTLLVAIQLLSGANPSPDQTEFDLCDSKILNGEFELEVGNTVIVPNVSCTVFDTRRRTDLEKGMWREFDPQFITPNTEIKPRLKLAAEATADTNVYFAMHVVSVAKN
jgi:hypothetical protein